MNYSSRFKFSLCLLLLRMIPLQAKEPDLLYHVVKEVNDPYLLLEDGSQWEISHYYRDNLDLWQPGDCVKVIYTYYWINNIYFENLTRSSSAWGVVQGDPPIEGADQIIHSDCFYQQSNSWDLISLKSNLSFKRKLSNKFNWGMGDHIFVFDNENPSILMNLEKHQLLADWMLVNMDECRNDETTPNFNIIQINNRLNQRVIAQSEATKSVSAVLL